MNDSATAISVIIPNLNGAHFLGPCLTSLFEQGVSQDELEVILIDNASSDGSVELVREGFPAVRIITNLRNLGFTLAVNQGLEAARCALILLLNNDTVMEPRVLERLRTGLLNATADIAGVQPLLLSASDPGIVDSAGIALGPHFRARDDAHGKPAGSVSNRSAESWGVCFACALIRRKVFDEGGFLDPDFFAERDDVDFCLRARWHGYRFMLIPEATVLHHRSATTERAVGAKLVRQRRNVILTMIKALPAGMATATIAYRLQRDLVNLPHHIRRGEMGAVWRSWTESLALMPRMLQRRQMLRAHSVLTAREMTRQIRHFMRAGLAEEAEERS